MKSVKMFYISIILTFFFCNDLLAQVNQWDGTIQKLQNEIRREEDRLARLEDELRDALSKRDKLIRDGYTYEDEYMLGDNPLISVDREIYVINGSIDSCKANIERLKNNISDARDKQRRLNDAIEKKVQEAQRLAKIQKEKNDRKKNAERKAAKQAADKAKSDAVKAQKRAEYEADMEAWREEQRRIKADEDRKRKEAGDKAATLANAKGEMKIQERKNIQRASQAVFRNNIESTSPNKMMSQQLQELGGNYSLARITQPKTGDTSEKNSPSMNRLLNNLKSKSTNHDNSNLDDIEKKLKNYKDLLDIIP